MTQSPWGQQRPAAPPQWNQQRPAAPPQWNRQPNQQWGPPQPGWGRAPSPAQPFQPRGQFPPPTGAPVGPGFPVGPGLPGGPPPKRRNPLRTMLLSLLLCLLLAAGLLVAMSALRGGTTVDVPEGEYRNEDYTPPPPDLRPSELPSPKTRTEAERFLSANRLYAQDVVTPVRCDGQDIDLERASKTQLETHMNELVACLMRTWEGPISQAGFELPRPSVTVYSSKINTKCGSLPTTNAVYCGADQQIYYASDLPAVMPPEVRGKRWTVESVVAHEFGHAVQARTGILLSTMGLQTDGATAKERKLYNRKLELQADCFAGSFMRSVAQSRRMTESELETIRKVFFNIGDDILTGDPAYDGEHGHGVNRDYWSQMGLAASSYASCNTYDADRDLLD